MAGKAGEGKAGGKQGAGEEEAVGAKTLEKVQKDVEKIQKEIEKPLGIKEVKPEVKEFKEKPEIKESKNEAKEQKPEIKEAKNEAKEHKPEFKEHKPEFKEIKPEIKEHKLELKEFKVEFEKHPKTEIKEFDKVVPDKLPGKEIAEGLPGGGGDPSPFAGLSRDALEAHAASLEQAAAEVRHFIEQADRPDSGEGALANEPDRNADS